jgi:hypothetical protein
VFLFESLREEGREGGRDGRTAADEWSRCARGRLGRRCKRGRLGRSCNIRRRSNIRRCQQLPQEGLLTCLLAWVIVT